MTESGALLPPFRHQVLSQERWFGSRRLGLAQEPGLGKSRTSLEGMALLYEVPRWLVGAPNRVARWVWPAENRKWGAFPESAVRVLGAEDFDLHAPRERPAGAPKDWAPGELLFRDRKATRGYLRSVIDSVRVVVCPWHLLFWLAAALGDRPHFQGVVWDESHFVSEKGTRTWQAARRLGAGADWRLALNGTPITNGHEKIFAQSYLLDEGATFGRTLTEFRTTYLQPVLGFQGRVVDWRAPNRLQEQAFLESFNRLWLPMRAADWLELPDLMPPNDILVDIEDEVWNAATQLMRAALAELPDGAQVLPKSVGAGLNKALQVCQGFIYDGDTKPRQVHSAKVEALLERLECVDGGALVFYPFVEDAAALKRALGLGIAFVDDRDAVKRFQEGEVKVLAAHPQQAGVGLDGLQRGGSRVIWYGGTWDLFYYEQGIKRLHRAGQDAPAVFVDRIRTRHPVEQMQIDNLAGKKSLLELVMEAKRSGS